MGSLSINPLSLNQLTCDTWGGYDAAAIAQLAGLAEDDCYGIKFYKAPGDAVEVVPANSPIQHGLRITPGSLIFGIYLPVIPNVGNLTASVPPAFTVQVTDMSLVDEDGRPHTWYDDPVSSLFLSNLSPTYQQVVAPGLVGSFPNLLNHPYPVVGNGLFLVDIQSTSAQSQRIELVFGVLEVCG